MNYKQLLTNSMVVIGLSCFTSLAFAATPPALTIHNNTKEYSTCKTHMGCSSHLLGDEGISRPGQAKEFSTSKIRIACKDRLANCVADVYMTNNCSGPVIASAEFSLDTGVKYITLKPGNNYAVNGIAGSRSVSIGYK